MKDIKITISGNTIENMIDGYAKHKALYLVSFDKGDEESTETMMNVSFCQAYEDWFSVIGISIASEMVQRKLQEYYYKYRH